MKNKRNKKKMEMKKIKKLGTFEDKVLVNSVGELESNLDIIDGDVMGLFQAPTGVGKTHSGVQLITPLFYEKRNVRFVLFIAPQKQLTGVVSLQKHIKKLKRKLSLVNEIYVAGGQKDNIGRIEYTLQNRDEDELVFVTMSDAFFNINKLHIERLINGNGLQNQTLILLDEFHYGSTSHSDYYKYTTGNNPVNYNAVKYNNLINIISDVYVLGLTATPTKEMLDDTFGTQRYVPINTYPNKEDLWKRTSSYQTPIFYDKDNTSMETSLMKFFEMVSDHQTITDSEADRLNLPDDCRVKFCGGIKIETQYQNKDKDDKKRFFETMNNISIPTHWDWDLSLDTSDELMVWRFQNGSVTELDNFEMNQCGYVDSDMLLNHLNKTESRLRFLVVVNKGTMGIDVSNLNFGLAIRVPGTEDPDGKPVVLSGEQWNGRFSRISVKIEELSQHFDDLQEFIKYYLLVNSYRQMLPESTYWRQMMNNLSQKLNSVDEVSQILND
jgi:hypothetical protein